MTTGDRSGHSAQILIDMSPLKAGGGCQLALNFLDQMSSNVRSGYAFLIPDVGPLAAAADRCPNLRFLQAPSSSAPRRVRFERLGLPKIYEALGTKVIYTFFGPGLPHPSSITSIVSVAYPIICYPDSPYWRYVSRKVAVRQRLVNAARVHRLKQAGTIIAETEVMRSRLARTLGRSAAEILVAPPAPSEFVRETTGVEATVSNRRVLVLSGVAPHKNVWRLPEIVHEFGVMGEDLQLVLTTSEEAFRRHLKPEGAQLFEHQRGCYNFVGSVAPDAIQDLYAGSAALLSLSDLESFSNNYLESWKTGTPLIASERDFAREMCGDSAVYVEPHDPKAAARTIVEALSKPDMLEYRKQIGFDKARALPSAAQKQAAIVDLVERYI